MGPAAPDGTTAPGRFPMSPIPSRRTSIRPGCAALKIVDLTGVLRAEDSYILDDHLRAAGHRKVADSLLPLVREALKPL